MSDGPAFADALREQRLARRLTQAALAERAGLSERAISDLERGLKHPQRGTVRLLIQALNLPTDHADAFELAAARVRSPAPQLAAHGASKHNLPAALTSFIGREEELTSVPLRLRAGRLLTLTGVGGSGKTRLAIELARRLVERYRDGVWLVELAQVAEPAFVAHRVAAVLGVNATAGESLEQALAETLRDSQILLVLDKHQTQRLR